jgi:hypothetical protein
MKLQPRGFYNGAKRSADLIRKGSVMNLSESETAGPSWSAGLLDFAKSAAQLVNQQRAARQPQNMDQQAYIARRAAPGGMNWGGIAMLGAAGVLAVILLKRVMR